MPKLTANSFECRELARRLGFRPVAVARWMRAVGITQISDLMHRYPGTHAESMSLARDEIEVFIFSS